MTPRTFKSTSRADLRLWLSEILVDKTLEHEAHLLANSAELDPESLALFLEQQWQALPSRLEEVMERVDRALVEANTVKPSA